MSMGGNAGNIINQQNRQAMQMMGYQPPVVPPSDPQQFHQFMMNQYNQSVNANKNYEQHQELLKILNEINAEEKGKRFNPAYYTSADFTAKTKSYTDALQYLKDMLAGKKQLSVKDAYFAMENAYGDSYLSQKEYSENIKQSVNFIKKWLMQNGYDVKDNMALHYGIQKFLRDTLAFTVTSPDNMKPPQTITHFPFFYDYNDFKGEKDFRNYFTTKCLATGSGQCNSLPAVYIMLAEGLGATFYLAFAPHHSFVKYPDNKGKVHSYEPTSSWNISDRWYEDNMFISAEAKRSGIYLDTLNKKQIVANCLLDLAFGYLNKFGAADGKFIQECIVTAIDHFPNTHNITAYFLYSSMLARMLDQELYLNNITDLKDINKSPRAVELFNKLKKNEETIKALGYQDTPEQLYEEVMQLHEFRGKKQEEKKITGKEKRNLFLTTN